MLYLSQEKEKEIKKMFEFHKAWCKNHGFPYKIVNGHFYWQTFIQTGEDYQDENGKWHTKWHPKNFFEEI